MKALIIVNVDWFFCSHRLPIALEALSQGYEVHIATTITNPKYRDILLRHGFCLHVVNIDRSATSIWALLKSCFDIYCLYRSIRPNLVHLVTIQPLLLGGLAARIAGITNIVYAVSGLGHAFVDDSLYSRVRKWIVLAFYRLALSSKPRAVIFQNPEDRLLLSKLCSLSKDETFLIPGSGVNLSEYVYSPLPEGEIVVMMASRLLSTKGVREFVGAASILKIRGIQANFKLVGQPDPSNPASISIRETEQWSRLGLVEILGYRNDLHHLMPSAHIICLPSYYPEGLPKVLCEAAACGRPVVTTNEPGCRDAVENGLTGILVPSRDSVALANALEHLIMKPALIRSMSLAARKRAQEMFDINAVVAKHLEIYAKLLKIS